MKKIDVEHWIYKECDIYLAEHPHLPGKYEIYKGPDFIRRAYSLKEAKQIIINKFGKMSKEKQASTKPKNDKDFLAMINNMLVANDMPTLGTKEFNDMCSNFFGGKPKSN